MPEFQKDNRALSAKKLKLLESAQKSIAKGQLDKAIKDYEQIVALDQTDVKQRQKLAELLVRVNRKEEAVAQYEIIAKHYSQGLFYLKAIAVHKQIQKLEPDNINTRLALASLYAKQGMIGNAKAEFNYAADHFRKEGSTAEALKVIELMVEADPDNLKSRQRLADAFYDAGQNDKAYLEFVNLALSHHKGDDEASFARICEKVSRLFPDKGDFALEVLTLQVRDGDASGAVPHLKELVNKEKTNLRAWELLAEAYLGTGETRERKEALRGIMENFPDRLSAAESLIQTSIDEGDIAGSLDLLKSSGPKFIDKGAVKNLERFYLTIKEMAPDNPAVLKGLKWLYEKSGEREKLALLTEAEGPVGPAETEMPEAPETPEPQIQPEPLEEPSPETPPGPTVDTSWEEEIDLSILDEEGAESFIVGNGVTETASSPEEPVSPDITEPETEREEIPENEDIPVTSEESGEISLEIDETVSSPEEPASPDVTETDADWGEIPENEEVPIASEEFSEISLEIDETALSGEDWLKALPSEESGDIAFPMPEDEFSAREEAETFTGEELPIPEDKEPPSAEIAETAELPEESPPGGKRRKKYDLDGQFSEFKKGLDQQLDEGDTETHYNLGIAYKEMGLYDDAVSEFRIAAGDPQRRTDCLTLQGICFRDKGDFAGAEQLFQITLSLEDLTEEEQLSINYELAFLYENMERKEESVEIYRRVLSINPGFRDAAKRIACLQGIEEGEETELLELDAEDLDQ